MSPGPQACYRSFISVSRSRVLDGRVGCRCPRASSRWRVVTCGACCVWGLKPPTCRWVWKQVFRCAQN